MVTIRVLNLIAPSTRDVIMIILLAFSPLAHPMEAEVSPSPRRFPSGSVDQSTTRLDNTSPGQLYDFTNGLVEVLLSKLSSQAFKALRPSHAHLEASTLAKLDRLANPSRISQRPLLPSAAQLHSATAGPSANYLPQLSKGTRGHHIQTFAYDILHDVGQLAATAYPLPAPDVKQALFMLGDLPKGWISWYNQEVLNFPLLTKASTSGIAFSLGDLFAQGSVGKNLSDLDLSRSIRSGAAGFIGHGPIAHYYLNFLDQALSFGGAWWAVLPKLVIEEGPMAIVYNTLYSLLLGSFAFRNPREVLKDVRAAFLPGFKQSLRFWPIIDLISFSIVPLELRVLWGGLARVFWVCIISRINNEVGNHNGPVSDEKKIVIVTESEH